jgi:hypothetical protein
MLVALLVAFSLLTPPAHPNVVKLELTFNLVSLRLTHSAIHRGFGRGGHNEDQGVVLQRARANWSSARLTLFQRADKRRRGRQRMERDQHGTERSASGRPNAPIAGMGIRWCLVYESGGRVSERGSGCGLSVGQGCVFFCARRPVFWRGCAAYAALPASTARRSGQRLVPTTKAPRRVRGFCWRLAATANHALACAWSMPSPNASSVTAVPRSVARKAHDCDWRGKPDCVGAKFQVALRVPRCATGSSDPSGQAARFVRTIYDGKR